MGVQSHDKMLLQKIKEIDAEIKCHLATKDKGEWDEAGRTNIQLFVMHVFIKKLF